MSELLDRALEVIRAERPRARQLGAEIVGVVGSVARGEERPESDVDVIIRNLGGLTFFKMAEIEFALEAGIGRPIDLVLSDGMEPHRKRFIERDLVPA
jgi:hypothetical protein